MNRKTWFYPLMLGLVMLMSGAVMAQGQGQGQGQGGQGQGGQGGQGFGGQGGQGDPNGGGGGRRGRGGNPQEFQLQQIREALVATDEEWSVLQPKVQALLAARNEVNSGARGGRGGGGRGRGNGGGGGGQPQQPETPVQRAMTALVEALNNASSPPELITQRLAALRDARSRAESSLTSAQKSLKELLTSRQEAVMVSLGFLP